MSCTTPQIPPSHASEAAEFAKQFAEQTTNFVKALNLPTALDPSVLSYKSRSGAYYVRELEDPEIVQPFVQDNVESAFRGLSIEMDTSVITNDVSNFVNAFVSAAKTVPTFGGFSSTSYRGTFSGINAIFKILLAIYATDASKLYDANPGSVLELAYNGYLTVQRAD